MEVEHWIRRLADDFWAAAGASEPFPRDLEAPTLWALPVAIIKIPRLGLASVRDWLEQRNLVSHPALRSPDRGLHGCLVVHGGEGIIFLDGADPAHERRVSLAHELAHFLVDYHAPRTRVVRRLGEDALSVLDNRRLPTGDERVVAALLGVSLAPHVHLLARDTTGAVDRAFIYGAESRADRLALELLAPTEAVWSRVAVDGVPSRGPRLVGALTELLAGEFGLPAAVAQRYARDLAGPSGEPSARAWLGLG